MVLYRAMTGSGGINSGPYRKHVKSGQNQIRAKQENNDTCNQIHNTNQKLTTLI